MKRAWPTLTVLLYLNERLPEAAASRRRIPGAVEDGDTTSLENQASRAIADVGEARPSRSRGRCSASAMLRTQRTRCLGSRRAGRSCAANQPTH